MFFSLFVDFNKGRKPAVAWDISEFSGFDKQFSDQTMGYCSYKIISSSLVIFSNSSVCTEVLLNPCEINRIQKGLEYYVGAPSTSHVKCPKE